MARSTASRYILSAGQSAHWSTGRRCGASDMGATVCERAPASAASDRDLLPETVPNDAPTRERSRPTIGAYHHGQMRPAVLGAGFTRAKQKGEGR